MEQCSSLAWPCGTEEISLIVKSYLDSIGKVTQFKNNIPGEDWMISFKRRWKDRIRMRKPEVLTKSRDENLNASSLKSFFDMHHKVISENGFFETENAADRIFNAEKKVGFQQTQIRGNCFFRNVLRRLKDEADVRVSKQKAKK